MRGVQRRVEGSGLFARKENEPLLAAEIGFVEGFAAPTVYHDATSAQNTCR